MRRAAPLSAMLTHSLQGEVLPLAFMGLTASLLKHRYGAGTTADKLVTRITRALRRAPLEHRDDGTLDGGDEKMRPRVVLFDEFSTLSTRLLEQVLTALERNGAAVERLVFLGDVEQNPAIERGALMPSFLRAYATSSIVQCLQTNHRAATEAQLLLQVMRRIRDGTFDGSECVHVYPGAGQDCSLNEQDGARFIPPKDASFAGVPFYLVQRPLFEDTTATLLANLVDVGRPSVQVRSSAHVQEHVR